jgi:hypothetical protein
MMMMDLKDCSLRQYLNDGFNSINWNESYVFCGVFQLVLEIFIIMD